MAAFLQLAALNGDGDCITQKECVNRKIKTTFKFWGILLYYLRAATLAWGRKVLKVLWQRLRAMPSPARSGSTHRTKTCSSSSVKRPCSQAEPLSRAGFRNRRGLYPLLGHQAQLCPSAPTFAAQEPRRQQLSPTIAALCLPEGWWLYLELPPLPAEQESAPAAAAGTGTRTGSSPSPGQGWGSGRCPAKPAGKNSAGAAGIAPGFPQELRPTSPNPSGAEPWGCLSSGAAGFSPRVAE